MKIGIVGNRQGWTYNEVRDVLRELNVYKTDIIISGGAEGVDTYAQRFAKEIGAKIVIIYPDPDEVTNRAYFNRNYKIAMGCDCLVAFNLKTYSGTLNTVRYAQDNHRPVLLIGKDQQGEVIVRGWDNRGRQRDNIHFKLSDMRCEEGEFTKPSPHTTTSAENVAPVKGKEMGTSQGDSL
jgi:predicted Rossmann fold nucleotide-binding protein DprA/Smf involved in DNA uptake